MNRGSSIHLVTDQEEIEAVYRILKFVSSDRFFQRPVSVNNMHFPLDY